MKSILQGLGVAVVGLLSIVFYLVTTFIGAVVTIVIIAGLFNLIF